MSHCLIILLGIVIHFSLFKKNGHAAGILWLEAYSCNFW